MEKIEIKLRFIINEINDIFDLREKLLKKDNLSEKDKIKLNLLNEFVDNLPFSLDSDVNAGFDKIKEFAKKVGKK